MLGKPCDEGGVTLPDGTPPNPQPPTSEPWYPYKDRVSFELADLLYRKEQMSGGNIDSLLDLWAASLFPHGTPSPFKDHDELYETIDRTPLGDVRWQSFNLSYGGPKPDGEVPTWMTDAHTVHFRDPREIIKNMLANPDFKDEIDYAPLREFDNLGDRNRRLRNFMGGDWVWRQAVSQTWVDVSIRLIRIYLFRTKYSSFPTRRTRPSSQSS